MYLSLRPMVRDSEHPGQLVAVPAVPAFVITEHNDTSLSVPWRSTVTLTGKIEINVHFQ